jgi:hypothetical protein
MERDGSGGVAPEDIRSKDMSMHDQTFRAVELPALPGKLGEIDALLQAARSSGALNGERAVLREISRIINRSPGRDIYQKPLG